MRRVPYNEVRYWGAIYPALDVRFLSEKGDREPVTRSTIFDSGSPYGLLPDDLVTQLDLPVFPLEKPIPTALGEAVNGCRAVVEVDGELTEPLEFVCLPRSARDKFEKFPGHRGLDLYALVGLDVFAELMLTFDQTAEEVFAGRLQRVSTSAARKMLSLISRPARLI